MISFSTVKCKLQITRAGYLRASCDGGYECAASVYKLKDWYLRLNTPPFPVHFRSRARRPDIAFKVAPHASISQ